MRDLSSRFYAPVAKSSFLDHLTIIQSDSEILLGARKLIRDHLRLGVDSFSKSKEGGGIGIIPNFILKDRGHIKRRTVHCHIPRSKWITIMECICLYHIWIMVGLRLLQKYTLVLLTIYSYNFAINTTET